MSVLEFKYRVNLKEVSTNGYISNKGILMMFEDIACYHSDLAGCGYNDAETTHSVWILLNWKVEVLNRVRYGDEVTVKTWTHSSNKLYSYRDFEMYDKENNIIAIATSKWVLIDTENQNVKQIPENLISVFSPEEKEVFAGAKIPKLIEPSNSQMIYSFNVQRRDIDVNNHMNNLFYLDYAYEALPEEIYKKDFKQIEIMYKYSAKLGNKVNCFYAEEKNSQYIVMKNEENSTIYCIVKLS